MQCANDCHTSATKAAFAEGNHRTQAAGFNAVHLTPSLSPLPRLGVLHRPQPIFMKLAAKHKPEKELLCLLSPRPAIIGELAIDLNTTTSGVMTLLKILDRRGFTTETVTVRGITRVFAAPAAWKKIKKAALEYWEATYGW